ncbi:MAG: cytochrome c biogenesis protein CcdA [Microgenomates group bacterium]
MPQLVFDGSEVTILIAFLGGILTFFASCLVPLVPTYLAYLSGVQLKSQANAKSKVFQAALFFVIGFITVFVLLGITLTQFASLVAPYRDAIGKSGGILFILMGLFMLGVFKQYGQTEHKLHLENLFQNHTHIHALLTGAAFGFGWSPCIGPVLAVILFWAAAQETMAKGILLLVVYGIGLGLPFLLAAVGMEKILKKIAQRSEIARGLTIFSAILIIMVGVALVAGMLDDLSFWITSLTRIPNFSS